MVAVELTGAQRPRIESVPPYVTTMAPDVIDLAALVGLALDDWQCHVLHGAMGQDDRGHWTAPEVGLVLPRQNGKTIDAEVAMLSAAFLFRAKAIYTAHLMSTTRKIRAHLCELIESSPDLDREVFAIRSSHEEQSIELRSRARIDFAARSATSGRGWRDYDFIFLDEALALQIAHIGALMPILLARSNWQLWYLSSAGKTDSHVLRRVRERGLKGDPALAYYEWSVPEEVYRDAPEYVANMPAAWAQANPSFNDRIAQESIARAQRSMDPDEFARECLGIWDDPRGKALIDLAVWGLLADADSEITSGVVFALTAAQDLEFGCIVAAGGRSDGIPHVEITSRNGHLDHRPGVDWMIPRVVELNEAHQPLAWIIDPSGPAGALLDDLRLAGIECYEVTVRELGQACGALLAAIEDKDRDKIRHRGQPAIRQAFEVARKRDIGDGGWSFGRRASDDDVSPAEGVALALHGLSIFSELIYDVLESIR